MQTGDGQWCRKKCSEQEKIIFGIWDVKFVGGHVRPKRVKTRKSGAACITERIVSAVLILPGTVSVRDALISVATVRQDTREEVLWFQNDFISFWICLFPFHLRCDFTLLSFPLTVMSLRQPSEPSVNIRPTCTATSAVQQLGLWMVSSGRCRGSKAKQASKSKVEVGYACMGPE